MTKEDTRRMHTSRPAMCSIQNSYIFAHSPYSKTTSTEASLSACGSSGMRNYLSKQCHWVAFNLSDCHGHDGKSISAKALPSCPYPTPPTSAPRGPGIPSTCSWAFGKQSVPHPKDKTGWGWIANEFAYQHFQWYSPRGTLNWIWHQKHNIVGRNNRHKLFIKEAHMSEGRWPKEMMQVLLSKDKWGHTLLLLLLLHFERWAEVPTRSSDQRVQNQASLQQPCLPFSH